VAHLPDFPLQVHCVDLTLQAGSVINRRATVCIESSATHICRFTNEWLPKKYSPRASHRIDFSLTRRWMNAFLGAGIPMAGIGYDRLCRTYHARIERGNSRCQ
jgi:hypothetical protein